jgi:cytochrome P450
LVQTIAYLADPTRFLDACQRRYGDVFTIETAMFGVEVAVVRPEDIKQIFTGDPDVLRAGEANVILEPLVGPRSVLLLDGAEHLRQRRLLMPPFHGERMLAYAETMRSITEQVVASLPVGRPFELHPHMQRITIEIILRTIFGVDEGARCDDLRDALTAILDRLSSASQAIWQIPPLRHEIFGLSPWASFKRDVRRADDLIYQQIARRRAERAQGGPAREDVLAMLLDARDDEGRSMTDPELRDELMTLLVAGHETTASMLCWAFDLILADARVRDRLAFEIRAVTGGRALAPADVGRLEYLDAVIKEVLRLRPVIPAVGRRLKAPMVVGGHLLPAETLVIPAIYLTHRLPELYPDPSAFRPERFLDKKPDPYGWLPFGGGIRRCVGLAFALYEMKVVIATMLAQLRLRKARPEPAAIQIRGFTFAPRRGAEVVVEGRIEAGRARAGAPSTASLGA